MTDKELIKQEIERLKHTSNAYDRSRFMLLEEIESFINSLPEEPASEDLEEAADKYAKEQYPWQNGYEKWELPIRDFKAGAEWEKQQMMKDAVETQSYTFSNTRGTFLQIKEGLHTKDGDKVKIAVLKTE